MNLTIPCETQAREFDAKLLLSCFAAERGHSVIVGSKKAINVRAGSLPTSIYLSKSLTIRNLFTYELLERLGHTIICGDEEGLVYASAQSYLHHKVAARTFRKADALLAWGAENAHVWREFEGFHGAPIYETGNARVDLLRSEMRPLFEESVTRLRAEYGKFILINTNFSRLNHYFPGQSRQANKLRDASAEADVTQHLDLGLAAHKSVLFDHFLAMVPAIASAHPEHTVVVRPHPSEKRETWTQATAGLANVRVVHEGNVVPWILASDLLIHNGCTTAIEAYVLGKTALAFQPEVSEDFDLHLPNKLSVRAYDLDSLLDLAKAHLSTGLPRDDAEEAEKKRLISQYVASVDGPLACERIVTAIEEFAREAGASKQLDATRRTLAKAGAVLRGIIQRCEAHIPGHHNNAKYLRHMFPGATLAEVEKQVSRYGAILGRFENVHTRQICENVFKLTGGPERS
jgi:surface carbohydrate biosynthesis protein